MKVTVDILCPNVWSDGICDSYESRVYFTKEIPFPMTNIFRYLEKEVLPKLSNLDEIHGKRFSIYLNQSYIGEINMYVEKPIEIYENYFRKVIHSILLQ